MRTDVLTMIGQQYGIAVLDLVVFGLHLRARRTRRAVDHYLWALTWLFMGLTHAAFGTIVWLADEPGTLIARTQALGLATTFVILATFVTTVLGAYAYLIHPVTARLVLAMVLGTVALTVGLSFIGADEAAHDRVRFSFALGMGALTTITGGVLCFVPGRATRRRASRWFGTTLLGYAIPLALYALLIGRGVGFTTGDDLDLYILVGHLDFTFTALLALNLAQIALARAHAAAAAHLVVEQRLAEAERLEGVGRLAAGVAHDFNNLLTVIRGNASFLAEQLPSGSSDHELIDEIQHAADRGTAMTQQLLAYSRRRPLEPLVLDVNELVVGFLPIVRRLVTEDIAVRWEPSPEPVHVRADRSRLEQLLLNLAGNARDAMPSGGELSLRVSRHGDRVELVVEDTGAGMSEDVARRATEPFFTTKPGGSGVGLGLATCVGIVTQAGGTLAIETEPGAGTTVTVTLPADAGKPSRQPIPSEPLSGLAGTRSGVVLVVEDERSVREVTARSLRGAGHHVIETANAEEALEVVAARGDVAVIVTDVVMPTVSGYDLARRAWERDPGLPVVFLSGYATEMVVPANQAVSGPSVFRQKPCPPDELVALVASLIRTSSTEATV
ncbi:MAG: ATP-binding protein [Gaiellales bacterium]